MSVLPFPRPRATAPARTWAELEAQTDRDDPACDVWVSSGERVRRYVVSCGTGTWLAHVYQVIGNKQVRCHRGETCINVGRARIVRNEFRREIADLLTDGWQVVSNSVRGAGL